MYDESLDELKQRFSVRILGELKVYTGCAFGRGWDSGILEMNQTPFAKNMVEQYNISATSTLREV